MTDDDRLGVALLSICNAELVDQAVELATDKLAVYAGPHAVGPVEHFTVETLSEIYSTLRKVESANGRPSDAVRQMIANSSNPDGLVLIVATVEVDGDTEDDLDARGIANHAIAFDESGDARPLPKDATQ